MKMRLQAFLRAGSWVVLAAGFACLPVGSALAEEIKIGVLEPFTGPWAKNGNESESLWHGRARFHQRGAREPAQQEICGFAYRAALGKPRFRYCGWQRCAARAKDLGVNLVFDEGYDQFMTDMTPLVQKLKDAKADVLIVISFINDTVLLHRKAKELDFNVPAVIGVSAGHSVPDLKDSVGTAVNGLFVSDLPVLVNPAALRPEVQAAAEEFNKRYEKVQHRVPAGHAVASFAALWTLFNDVLPKAKSIAAEDVRAAALSMDLPPGSLINGSGLKFSNFDLPNDPKDAGQNIRSSIGVWQWQNMAARQVYPKNLATNEIAMVPLPDWAKR